MLLTVFYLLNSYFDCQEVNKTVLQRNVLTHPSLKILIFNKCDDVYYFTWNRKRHWHDAESAKRQTKQKKGTET